MSDINQTCPICPRVAYVADFKDRLGVQCAHCGNFEIVTKDRPYFEGLKMDHEYTELLPFLSAYTRQASERQEDVVLLDHHNWRDLAIAHKDSPLSRKLAKLIECIASKTKPGKSVKFSLHTDAPLIDAESAGEMAFLLSHLKETGFVKRLGAGHYALEVKAWEQIETSRVGGDPGKCFVAMFFHPSLNEAYKMGIYLGVKDCKIEPIRMDGLQHNDKICDKIQIEIQNCRFLVADATLQRPGVYFEAGFAMGLGRAVIWMCRKDDFDNVHFDTRQYNHIVWEQPSELREKLADRIKATILKGNVRV